MVRGRNYQARHIQARYIAWFIQVFDFDVMFYLFIYLLFYAILSKTKRPAIDFSHQGT